MTKSKVFVTRIIRDRGLELVKEFAEADIWTDELPPSHDVIMKRVRGVDGLLCLLTDQIDAEIMDAAGPQLKVISNHAVGYDNVDVAAATERGICVGNTPSILTDATADMAFALMMAAGRNLVQGENMVRTGKWKTWGPSILIGQDFVGATLGIIGFGRIGQALAQRAQGFNMRTLYYDLSASSRRPDLSAVSTDLGTLLRESDFISIHVPLTTGTYHMINADVLARLKPNCVLVNTSRGAVVDQDALYEALKSGRIFAAALDVTDPEPLPLNSPLLELDNCIITPHIASASIQSRDMMAFISAKNLIAGLNEEHLQHCVNPEVYERRGH